MSTKNKGGYSPWKRLTCTCETSEWDSERRVYKPCGGTSFSCEGSYSWDEATQDWEADDSDLSDYDTCHGCGEEGDKEESQIEPAEVLTLIEGRVKGNAEHGKYRRCAVCGEHEYFYLLDEGKCVACYGEGWAPLHAPHIAYSIRPDLLPAYLDWLKGAMVRAKIKEAAGAA